MWVRRTNSPIAGPGKARVLGPSTINAPNQPICSARYAPSAEPALPSCCPLATPRPCSSISTKSQRKSPPAHTPFSFSIKLDGTAPKTSRLPKHLAPAAAAACARSSALKMAVYAGELAVEPHLQILRRNRRPGTPGTRSSISPGKSCPSLAAIGQSPVTHCEDWYKVGPTFNDDCAASSLRRVKLDPNALIKERYVGILTAKLIQGRWRRNGNIAIRHLEYRAEKWRSVTLDCHSNFHRRTPLLSV